MRTKQLEIIRGFAEALLALCALQEQESAPLFYTSKNYPFGAKEYRKHVRQGMPAIPAGRGYSTKRDDAERFWLTLRKPPKARAVSADDLLARSGVILAGAK